MFKNYILIALRRLTREKTYAAINIVGLALGIACCLILGLYLRSELTYDQHYRNHERIYRLVNEFTDRRHQRQVCAHLARHRSDARRRNIRNESVRALPEQCRPSAASPSAHGATTSSTGRTATSPIRNVFEMFPVEDHLRRSEDGAGRAAIPSPSARRSPGSTSATRIPSARSSRTAASPRSHAGVRGPAGEHAPEVRHPAVPTTCRFCATPTIRKRRHQLLEHRQLHLSVMDPVRLRTGTDQRRFLRQRTWRRLVKTFKAELA